VLLGVVRGGGTVFAFEFGEIGARRTDLLIQSTALGIGDGAGRVLRRVRAEFTAIEMADKRATTERDRMQERLNLIDQRLSAAEATIKALQPKP
jgi:hypothetical protein